MTTRTVIRTERVFPTNDSPAVSVPDSVMPFRWSMIESTNYETFVANLRAIDCPAQTIRDIISGELDDQYDQKLAAILSPLRQQFWQIIADLPANEKKVEEKFNNVEELIKERDALLEKLVGAEPNDGRDAAGARAQYEYLSQETYERLRALEAEHQDKIAKLRTEMRGKSREEIRQQNRILQTDFEKARKELMGPEEYEEFRLRRSRFASIRNNQALVGYSEEEIRAIVKVQQDFFDEYPAQNEDGKVDKEAVEERDAQLKEQLKVMLGNERYVDFARSQDNRFQQIYRVTERYDLPRETAVKVYDIRQSAEQQAHQLAGATALSTEERDALLDLLINQTAKDLRATLGDDAAESYHQLDGKWLVNLGARDNP